MIDKIVRTFREKGIGGLTRHSFIRLWIKSRHHPFIKAALFRAFHSASTDETLKLFELMSVEEQMELCLARSGDILRKLKSKAGSSRVLFIVPRGMHYDLVLQSFLAYRLMFDGATCKFLICQRLPRCNQNDAQSGRPAEQCSWCEQTNRLFLDIAHLPYVTLDKITASELRERADTTVSKLSYEECERFEYKDYHLGAILKVAAARYMLRAAVDETVRDEATKNYQDFLLAGIVLLEANLKLVADEKPDVMVMVNGKLLWSAIAQAVADRHGISTISYEDIGAMFKGRTWVFSLNRPIMELDFTDIWEQYMNKPLTASQECQLDDYLASRRQPGLYYREIKSDPDAIRKEIGLKDDEKPVTLFTNVVWDSAALGKDTCFDGVMNWVLETVEMFIASGRSLVVRVHPAEGVAFDGTQSRERIHEAIMQKFDKLPSNIHIIPSESPVSSYTLIQISGAAIVYTSTIGFEAVLDGIPCVVCGVAHYGNKGFTYDIISKQQYIDYLDSLETLSVATSQREMARRYAYLYYFQLPLKIDLWSTKTPIEVEQLKPTSLSQISPGNMPNLDIVASTILNGVHPVIHR